MAVTRYEKCAVCKGTGYLSCRECVCWKCGGKKVIPCKNCKDGYIPCGTCSSTGRIYKKRLLFSNFITCPNCYGSRKVPCNLCQKTQQVSCSECTGTGRISSCSACGGSLKAKCRTCDGAGKIESQEFSNWIRSFENLPVDRLRYEHEKRQRKIQQLQTEILRLEREVDEIYSDVRDYEREDPKFYNHGGYPIGLTSIPAEIRDLENDVKGLEDELDIIDKILDSKWR